MKILKREHTIKWKISEMCQYRYLLECFKNSEILSLLQIREIFYLQDLRNSSPRTTKLMSHFQRLSFHFTCLEYHCMVEELD
jgi:hypothetical protein